MHLLPLGLGILAILVGIAMVAFGIPNNEFGTGNTLIAAGTTAVVGGFILLGLWAAVAQLQRLLNLLQARSTSPGHDPAHEPAPGPEMPRTRRDRDMEAEKRPALAPREPRIAPEEPYEHEPAESPEPEREETRERFPWMPGEESQPAPRRTQAEPAEREEESSWELFAPRVAPARDGSFDAIWPSDRGARDTREAPEPGERGRSYERSRPGPRETEQPASPSEPDSTTILKSGVINGMAYTLYTDGSIEAELPQGTLRFGSLEELRDYLGGNL